MLASAGTHVPYEMKIMNTIVKDASAEDLLKRRWTAAPDRELVAKFEHSTRWELERFLNL